MLLSSLSSYLSKVPIRWAVCGGSAIDLFLGRQSRSHKDLDVSIFWDQRQVLLIYLLQEGSFRIFEPEEGLLREITSLEEDFQRNDNLWCIQKGSDAYQITPVKEGHYAVSTA